MTQYYFEPTITEEEKKTIKELTSQPNANIAIYVSVNDNVSVSTETNALIFNKAKITFNVSRNVIINASKCLLPIICFVKKTEDIGKIYTLTLTQNNSIINLLITEQCAISVGSIRKQYYANMVDDNITIFGVRTQTYKSSAPWYIDNASYDLTDQYNNNLKQKKNLNIHLPN